MSEDSLAKRFGDIALQKKFITKNQLLEAMRVQIENKIEKAEHKLIGAILIELGYMSEDQVNQVLDTMSRPKQELKCPNCGILVLNCPNCGSYLR